jgi:hypothetical protein
MPTAGRFGGDAWLKLHEAHVKTVQSNQGALDVLLVGDSITIQWSEQWNKHFPELKAINFGIGGEKTQTYSGVSIMAASQGSSQGPSCS